jgi:integrase
MVGREPSEEWRIEMIYKRGNVYWFEFRFQGKRIQQSTKQRNADKARDLESIYRSNLVNRRAGIEPTKEIPTLTDFQSRFLDEIRLRRKDHPETIQFYGCKYSGLLKFGPLAQSRLDRIDEKLISEFTSRMYRDGYEESTINRHLATLKRALRLARKWKIIGGVPTIEMLAGENQREFTVSREQQRDYFDLCPEFLRNWAQFALETGMRRKELLFLEWPDVHFDPVGKARGYVHVRGTKSKNSMRNLSLTATAQAVLLRQKQISRCDYCFVRETDHTRPASISGLNHAHERVRQILELPAEFVLHSLRHTFGTRLGEAGVDAFTIMRIMGHSSITVSQRYVHPTPETMENAFIGLERATEEAEKNPVTGGFPTNLPTIEPTAEAVNGARIQ